jgi:transposase
MLSQDQWGAIRSLFERGLGKKAIARELGISVPTVRRYLRQGGRLPYRRPKPALDALERDHGEYLRQRAPAVQWMAQVLFQEIRARGFAGCYELVKRWVRPLREEQARLAAATVRFETGPGRQAQADWGTTGLSIGGVRVRAHLFVLTLGFSRRLFARAYPHERLAALIDGHERGFAHFGGRTEEILYDNPRTIVLRRDMEGRHIEWNPIFRDFAERYGFHPRLCRPYRAQTKGKVESGVKYVKGNALRGREFTSWEQLNDWLLEWATTIADLRVHGTTHERPIDRFSQEALLALPAIEPYRLERHPSRIVATDCLVSLETNRYSVPWQLVGETVALSIVAHEVRVFHRGKLVAQHPLCTERHRIIRDPAHYQGLVRLDRARAEREVPTASSLLWRNRLEDVEVRDLGLYEAVAAAGGGR